MGQGKYPIVLWRHAAVAVIYALGFVALREVSFSHWVLFAGFRLSALLLVPYRYWPALLVGEMGPLGYTALMHGGRYGSLWSALLVIPPIGVAMPVVRWCRERLQIFQPGKSVHMTALLVCTLVVSVFWTLMDMGIVATAKLPVGYPPLQFTVLAARWFIGNFLGVLTLVPLVLLVREEVRTGNISSLWQRMVGSRLFKETVFVLMPSLAVLVWLAFSSTQEPLRESARMAMFLPVIWLSLRNGWYGAAIGGTLASVAVVLTMPAKYDESTLQAQVFIAFATTTMLLLGERIALLSMRGVSERTDARLTLALAQRNVVLGEMQLRQTSSALEHVREAVQSTYGQMLEKLRPVLPVPDEREYRLRAALTQQQLFRLADSLHPVLWRDDGISAALRQGSIARALEESGIRYWCDVRERGLAELSPGLHMAVYRTVCEAVASVSTRNEVGKVMIRLRPGCWGGRRWVVVQVDGQVDSQGPIGRVNRDELLLRLSSSGLGIDAIKDRVSLFRGRVNHVSTLTNERISMIFHDVGEL